MLLFLTTNMAAVTSRGELGHRDVTSNSSVKFRFSSGKIVLMLLTEKIRTKTIKKAQGRWLSMYIASEIGIILQKITFPLS